MKTNKQIKLKLQLYKTFAKYFDTPNELLEYCNLIVSSWTGDNPVNNAVREMLNANSPTSLITHEDAEKQLIK